MERENTIEKYKHQLRQNAADLKLANMENEAICRNRDIEGYEYRRRPPAKSPATENRRTTAVNKDQSAPKVDHDGSYLDVSMSYSPSPMVRGRDAEPSKAVTYGDRLKKSLERKTMAPLIESYQSDIASRQRAAALAEADRMIERGNKYRGMTDLKYKDTQNSEEKPRSKSRESAKE